MRNILAENMLRFGPKNLNDEHVMRLRLLQEQEEANPFANDDESVKAHPLYNAVTQWWIKNSKVSINTLKIWQGMNTKVIAGRTMSAAPRDYADGIKTMEDQIAYLKTWGTTPAYTQKPAPEIDTADMITAYEKVKSWLQKHANNGIYITHSKLSIAKSSNANILKFILWTSYRHGAKVINDKTIWKNQQRVLYLQTDKDPQATIKWRIDALDDILARLDKEIAKNDVNDEHGPNAGAFVGFTPFSTQNKLEALNYYQERANAVVESDSTGRRGSENYSKITTVDEAIAKAVTINIKASGSETQQTDGSARTITAEFTERLKYPNPDTDDPAVQKLMETMFVDDAFQVTDPNNAIYNYIYDGLKSLIDRGAAIDEIKYAAFASTSKVRTSFTGQVDAKGKAVKAPMSMDNNIPLADARVNSIQSYLKTCIDDALSKLNITAKTINPIANTVQPNIGPEWEKVDDLGPAATLYNQAKQNAPGMTPREFYGARKTSELEAEYNAVYGPFRRNFGFVEITGTLTTTTEELDPGVTGSSKYKYRISWEPGRTPPKKKPRGSVGGGESFVDVKLNTLGCPFPNGSPGWWQNLNKGN